MHLSPKKNPKPGTDETNVGEEKPFGALLFPEIKQDLQVSAEDLLEEGWCKFLLPGPVGCLCDTESLIWFCDASDNVFVAEVDQLPHRLKWQKTDFKASMVVATPNCSVVWRLHNHSAFALVQQNPISISSSSSSWTKICDNVASLSLNQDTGWIVKL